MSPSRQGPVRRLLKNHGTTYAEQAGITLRDKPSPLHRGDPRQLPPGCREVQDVWPVDSPFFEEPVLAQVRTLA